MTWAEYGPGIEGERFLERLEVQITDSGAD